MAGSPLDLASCPYDLAGCPCYPLDPKIWLVVPEARLPMSKAKLGVTEPRLASSMISLSVVGSLTRDSVVGIAVMGTVSSPWCLSKKLDPSHLFQRLGPWYLS